MCGFTGFWDFTKTTTDVEGIAFQMQEAIRERGPDSFGIWSDQDSGFVTAHRRLAIVDLSPNGHQPMISRSGRFIISYNGEVFNTDDLKTYLPNFPWRGHSDTEAILELSEAIGIQATAEKLIGMFGYALYDTQEKILYLVRDRLGIKPIYYGVHNETLFFGSQLKSFLPHPKFKKRLNKQALALYFKLNFIPAPHSIYDGILKLEQGNILRIDAQQNIQKTQFWSMYTAAEKGRNTLLTGSPDDVVAEYESLLKDAVKRRMMADVPLGAFLSGGVDSSLVAAIMQSESNVPIKTFTIGFHEQQYNEAPHALAVAKHLGTDHFEEYLPINKALDIIPDIPKYCDEPFADSSQIPTLLVSQLARKHVIVSLSGDGGDEFFAGYTRYFDCMKAHNILKHIPSSLKKCAHTIGGLIPDSALGLLGAKQAFRYRKALSVLSKDTIEDLYNSVFDLWFGADMVPGTTAQHTTRAPNNLSDLAYLQYHDAVNYLTDDILVKVDRASMHTSLEARVPLLDHRLVEFSWRVPDHLKVRNGQSKWILREVLYKYVPKQLIERPKMGFGVPIDMWLKGPLKEWAEELLQGVKSDGLLNYDVIKKTWDQHQAGTMNWQYSLWGVLMWQHWRNQYEIEF